MTQSNKSYASITIKKLEKSRVEIIGSIAPEIWGKYRTQAIKNINESITLDGFRKGMIPENILIARVGDSAILEEMAELALSKAYIEILVNEKIDAIGKPEIHITKLAKDNPLEFKATTSMVPEVVLPDYAEIAKEQIRKRNPDDEKVTEKDIDDTITRIRTRASKQKAPANAGGHSPDHDRMTLEEHAKVHAEAQKMADEAPLPELTDDFVKTLGDFGNVSDFKNKLSEMITEQKQDQAREKLRIQIADALVDSVKIDLPEIMIEAELNMTQSR